MNDASASDLSARCAAGGDGTVRVELDLQAARPYGQPGRRRGDSNIWIYALIILCLAAFWRFGAWPGLGATAASLTLYLTPAALRETAARRRVHRGARG